MLPPVVRAVLNASHNEKRPDTTRPRPATRKLLGVLRKPANQHENAENVDCRNLIPARGCDFYGSRPSACRPFRCGWRMLGGLDDTWRPDRSNVMIRVEQEGLVVQRLASVKQILAQKVFEFIGTCIANGITIFVNMPAHKGKWRPSFRSTICSHPQVQRKLVKES